MLHREQQDIPVRQNNKSKSNNRLRRIALPCRTNAADRQRIEVFVRRGVRSGFYSADSPTAAELVSDSDDKLFENVLKQF